MQISILTYGGSGTDGCGGWCCGGRDDDFACCGARHCGCTDVISIVVLKLDITVHISLTKD